MLPNWRKRDVPAVRDGFRYRCPICGGKEDRDCGHCLNARYVICGPTLHQIESTFEWPEFGGTYGTCARCFDTVLQVAHGARNDGGHMNEVA